MWKTLTLVAAVMLLLAGPLTSSAAHAGGSQSAPMKWKNVSLASVAPGYWLSPRLQAATTRPRGYRARW